MSITKKISSGIENVLALVLGGMFLVWSLAYLLAHDTWQKIKATWNRFDSSSSFPMSGAMGGAAIGGLLAGPIGGVIGAISGWFVGAASSLKKQANEMAAANRAEELAKLKSATKDVPVKTKTKKEKVKKQSKNSKTSDTIVPPAPKKKPGRPRKKSAEKKAE